MRTDRINVLITGVGGGVGQSVIKALKLANRSNNDRYRLVGVDRDRFAAGLYRCHRRYLVPDSQSEDYLDRLAEIANFEGIDVVIPGSDPEVARLARESGAFRSRCPSTHLLVADESAVMIGFDKWRTFLFLTANGFPAPFSSMPEGAEEMVERFGFPLIVKPRFGSASNHLIFALDRHDLDYALRKIDQPIIQEYLVPANWSDRHKFAQYDEFSSEVLMDGNARPISSITNWRRLKKGIPNVAVTTRAYPEIDQLAESVAECMKVFGPVNFQSRICADGVKFFEINTRFSGSTAVRCMAGRNGPDIMVRLLVDRHVPSDFLGPVKRFVELRFNNELYVPLEDENRILETDDGASYIPDYF